MEPVPLQLHNKTIETFEDFKIGLFGNRRDSEGMWGILWFHHKNTPNPGNSQRA